MRVATCPEPARLKELLDNALPGDEQADLIAHLDECECCQQMLECLAAGGSPLFCMKCDRPDETSAFWPALGRVRQAIGETRAAPDEEEEIELDFLAPSESPEYLGRLGTYEIMEPIGHGGMGVVLRAFDPCLSRQVAIKVLAPRYSDNELARKRFCREARAAARVSHENVVAVYLVDEEESANVPFLVMQLVEGESLQERLDRKGALDLKTVVRFGQQVAAGLTAAHDKGLVHRDIKPANILIESPLERIKLTDFGLARAEEDAKLTQTGFVAGTPLYMAPEQAKGDPIDHRADLFSFGSVLYAMCTGKPPFEGSTPFVILKNVTEVTPTPIQVINPEIPDWLVAVIAKLQSKDPADRYQSAGEVEALFAEASAVLASGGSLISTRVPVCKGVHRAAKVGVLAWAVAGLLVAALMATEMTGVTRIVTPMFGLGDKPPIQTLDAKAGSVWSIAFTPDNKTVVSMSEDGKMRLWDVATGGPRGEMKVHPPGMTMFALSPDGRSVATASADGTAKVWDLAKLRELRSFAHPNGVRAVAFARDGGRIATGGIDGVLRIWDLETGQELAELKGHNGPINAVAFAPNDETIASAGADAMVKIWDVEKGVTRQTLSGHDGAVLAVGFTPDGKGVVSGSWDKSVRLWDLATGQVKLRFDGNTQDVWTVGVCPRGGNVVSGGEDQVMRVWNLSTGKLVKAGRAHDRAVYTVTFSRDGALAASAGRDGTVKIWSVDH